MFTSLLNSLLRNYLVALGLVAATVTPTALLHLIYDDNDRNNYETVVLTVTDAQTGTQIGTLTANTDNQVSSTSFNMTNITTNTTTNTTTGTRQVVLQARVYNQNGSNSTTGAALVTLDSTQPTYAVVSKINNSTSFLQVVNDLDFAANFNGGQTPQQIGNRALN